MGKGVLLVEEGHVIPGGPAPVLSLLRVSSSSYLAVQKGICADRNEPPVVLRYSFVPLQFWSSSSILLCRRESVQIERSPLLPFRPQFFILQFRPVSFLEINRTVNIDKHHYQHGDSFYRISPVLSSSASIVNSTLAVLTPPP